MKNLCIDNKTACLITNRHDRRYLLGCDVFEGYLLVTSELNFFTDARYFGGVKESLNKKGIKVYLYKSLDTIKEFLLTNKIENLYVDFNTETVSSYNLYKDFGVNVLDLSAHVHTMRAIKSEDELNLISKSCEICQKTFYQVLPCITKGVSELEIKTLIERMFIDNGAEGVAFDTIVAFGENGAIPHHVSSEKQLENDMPVLIDMGCVYKGYCSDLTRTVFYGKPSEEFLSVYSNVQKANELAIESIKDGTYTNQADGFAREYLKSANLDEYFTHSLGHGIGLEVHEYPYLSPKKRDKLLEGMVFSIEPGVYLQSQFGVRIEDTVAIKSGKVVRLFTDKKDLILIK